jgi:hypothetical protein
MEAEQEPQEGVHYEEEADEESVQSDETQQEVEQEEYIAPEEATEQKREEVKEKKFKSEDQGEDRSNFVNGLSVGLGIGCIASFVMMWIAVFFTPQLPSAVTYENLLAIFIYPLIYLLTIGLIALTAGVVREYFSSRNKL